VGPITVRRLLDRLGDDVGRAAAAAPRDLAAVGRSPKLATAIRRARPGATWEEARALGQRVLTPASPGWPHEAFLPLADPPSALFVRGALPPPDVRCIAVVGSRDAGAYGVRMAHRIAGDLAAHGVWIASGMAVGIDGAAHAGTVSVPGGRTVAALGCGIDVAYPLEHLDLKETVAQAGGLLSEHPPRTQPRPGHFPRRNRIVAALSDAVVVVAAGPRSGALITARLALELGRQVLAVPGPCGAGHRGSHALLKRGEAALCESARDVFLALDPASDAPQGGARPDGPPPPDGPPLAVWTALQIDEAVGADELTRRVGLGAGEVIAALTFLEVEGYVRRSPGGGYRRR
jgi:DNA processing protein